MYGNSFNLGFITNYDDISFTKNKKKVNKQRVYINNQWVTVYCLTRFVITDFCYY